MSKEISTPEEWLGEENKLGIDIWTRKYQRNGESFPQWLERVSGGDEAVADLIKAKKFLPAGRILSNRGITGEKVTFSNCFSGDTKILTQDGVLPLADLVGRDDVKVFSNGWRDATVRSFGVQQVKLLTLEKMGVEKQVRVTGDHIWFASKTNQSSFCEVKTDELEPGMKLQRAMEDMNSATPQYPDLWSVKSVSDVVGEEEVFCAVVPSTQSFALEGNILTHNCYVVAPPEDSIESIYDSRKKLARTYSYGGGCGIDLSGLAPSGARVRNQAKQTTGAVSFMQGFSHTTEEIGQNGRRGALMISLSCTHPDLLEFIKCKMDVNAVTKANISVRVTDEFMNAVVDHKPWELSFTREETEETVTKVVDAAEVFELLCRANWDYAEPGVLFWDRIKHWNLLSNHDEFQYAGVNPCGKVFASCKTSGCIGESYVG